MTLVGGPSDELPTRVALLASAFAVLVGLTTLAYMLADAGPIILCDLWPPPRCLSPNLSGPLYFSGDSQAAPVFHVALALVGPMLAVWAAFRLARARFASALALAGLACLPYSIFLFGAYALMPLHALVAGGVLVTLIAVSVGTTRAVWAPQRA